MVGTRLIDSLLEDVERNRLRQRVCLEARGTQQQGANREDEQASSNACFDNHEDAAGGKEWERCASE